jgi:multiple sugar transport system permease protein
MLALPAVILLAILVLLPLLFVFGLGFTDYRLGSRDWSFIGFANYEALLSDARSRNAFLHTAAYVAIVTPASLGFGLAIALAIQARKRFRRVYEVVFFLPVTSTFVAMAIVWQFLLHGRIGPVNRWLEAIGMGRIDFLTDPAIALTALAGIGTWQLIGQTTVLFLAGLASIPSDVYDAAALDGMGRGWDRLIRITLPMLAPTTLFVAITTSITAFQVFDSVAALTRGGPAGATDTALYRIYQEAYRYTEMGAAAAISVVFLAVIALFSLAQLALTDRRIHYG